MVFASVKALKELQNNLETLQNEINELAYRIEDLEKNWEQEVLKLANAKDLMSRAAARLERSAERSAPPPEEPDNPNGDRASKKPAELTNPLARQMLGIQGE